jgi:hypothetical protein
MNPLTDELRAVFVEAILRFNDWVRHGNAEPSVQLESNRQFFTISEFCQLIRDFENEPLLDPALELLFELLTTPLRPRLVERIGRDQSYHTGASCLADLIEERNAQQAVRQISRSDAHAGRSDAPLPAALDRRGSQRRKAAEKRWRRP